MTQRNRKTLTDYFSDGQLPTQEKFGDLIDSMVNVVDDGFEKNAKDGLMLTQLGGTNKLISFFDGITVKSPLWSIAFDSSGYGSNSAYYKNLNFFYGSNKDTGLTLACAPDKSGAAKIRVGINKNNPQHELDIEGVIAADGRIGRKEKEALSVPADGDWHPIITGLDGCHAFEIMAGVGKKRSGRYALLHAFALNTFNSKKSNITSHQAHFSSRCDQIDLRWVGDTHNYSLEMRTRCRYFEPNNEDEIFIRYYTTRLWFDPAMDNSSKKNEPASNPGGK